MLIIGIGHQKHSGKDSFSSFMLESYNFRLKYNPIKVNFADALKEEFAGILGATKEEIAKKKELWRPGLQWYGTEYTQHILGEKLYWVNRVKNRIPFLEKKGHGCVIISDVRFLHEVEFVKQNEGLTVEVTRFVNPSNDPHKSEQELADYTGWDLTIYNSGTIEELKQKAIEFAEKL